MPKPVIGKPVSRPPVKKKTAPIHKLPDPIKEGEIVNDIQKRQWRLGKSIGVGGFGEIYAASDKIDRPVSTADAPYVIKIEPHSNGPLFVEMNFYMRVAKPDMIEEWVKSKKLKFLGMPRFIGSGSHEYKGEKYRFMIMQRFGTDVQKLFEASQKRFPVNTVINLALRIIDVLEYIHHKQYVHADIKGSNLLLGFGKGNENQVWLVDFGLAWRYTVDGVHKEYKPDLRKAHNGTIEFTSRDAHIGVNGRRGDFEILGYNMLQWLCSRLPWEDNLKDQEYVAAQKEKYMANIPLLIKQCFPAKNAPAVIVQFLEMTAKLKFEEKPDYDKFRQLLRRGLKEGGYADDGVLVFPCLKTTSAPVAVRASPAKKRALPPPPQPLAARSKEEAENKADDEMVKRVKSSGKKNREPLGSPKVTNRPTRRVNLTPDSSSDASNSQDSTTDRKDSKKENGKLSSNITPSTKRDTSLCNPTPAMLAILARMRTKEQSPSPAPAAKKKHARLDSRSCSPVDLDTSSILTPAMEEVIRVREVRMSMEQSGHFFTPICSPAVDGSSVASPDTHFRFPSSTPADRDLYMTLDISSEEEEPVRKKSNGGRVAASPAAVTPTASTRNRRAPQSKKQEINLTSSSVDSSTAAELTATPEDLQRRIYKRKYSRVVEMASASTQTSPGVLGLPSTNKSQYALRSCQLLTPRNAAKKGTPPVVDLSPDMFRQSPGGSP